MGNIESKNGSDRQAPDWRQPLYESACRHLYSGGEKEAEQAAREFSFLGDWKGSEKKKILSEERITAIRKEKKKKVFFEKMRLYGSIAVLVLFVLTVVGLTLNYYLNTLPKRWEEACAKEEAGDYTGALELMRKIDAGKHRKEAEERVKELIPLAAGQKLSEKDYAEALALYQEVNDEAGILSVYDAQGDEALESGDYAAAADFYKKAENKEKERTAVLRNADVKEEKGLYEEAIHLVESLGETDENDEARLKRLRASRCLRVMTELMIMNQTEHDPEKVRKCVETIDDLDSVLQICEEISREKYSLEEIFPVGIIIRDIDFSVYRPDVENKGLSRKNRPKAIVLTRRQIRGDLKQYMSESMIGSFLEEPKAISLQSEYIFEPAVFFALPDEVRAKSFRECGELLLVDSYWRQYGTLSGSRKVKSTGTSGVPSFEITQTYPLFEAVDNVTLYDREKPDHFYIVGYELRKPELYESPVIEQLGYRFVTDGEIKDFEACWGKSDPEFLDSTYRKGVSELYG